MDEALAQAASELVAELLADAKAAWAKEVEIMSAESRAVIAELRGQNAELVAGLKEASAVHSARVSEAIAGIRHGKDADPEEMRRAVTEQVERAVGGIPVPKDGASVTVEQLAPSVEEAVTKALSNLKETVAAAVAEAVTKLPPAPAGKDADPELIATMVRDAVAAIPVPKDGTSVTVDDVAPILGEAVARGLADLDERIKSTASGILDSWPKPKDGESVTVDQVRPVLEEMIQALPPAKDGKDVDPAQVKAMIEEAVSQIPAPKDGASVTLEDVAPLIERAVEERVASIPTPKDGESVSVEQILPAIFERIEAEVKALPVAKDGVGLAGAMINREGNLVITLTNGEHKNLGPVVGRDADPKEIREFITAEIAKIPTPKDGVDGLGFDDMAVEYDGERSFELRWSRGDVEKSCRVEFPVVLDRGVFKDGSAYARGDGVTWGGSYWIAQSETSEKPGEGKEWRLAVKKGRDGKEVVKLPPRDPKAPVKLNGASQEK